jgi:hypothetical protein
MRCRGEEPAMQRTINWVLMLAALAGTFALYAIKDGTRRLEARVQAQERALERAENDVSVLTAERAHLARPERLEPLARKLGMAPVSARQYLSLEAGRDRKTPVDAFPPEHHNESGNPAPAPAVEVVAGSPPRASHRAGDASSTRRGNDDSSVVGIPPAPRIESGESNNPSPLAAWLSKCSSCLNPPRGPPREQGGEETPLRAGQPSLPATR